MSNRNREIDYPDNERDTWNFLFAQAIKQDVHTALPATIVSYDSSTKRALVQPSIRLVLTGDLGEQPRAPIPDVPVFQPSAGGFAALFPVREGDPVMLIFSERGITQFKERYEESTPDDDAPFSPRDAVALLGFGGASVTPKDPAALSIQSEDGGVSVVLSAGEVRLEAGGNVLLLGAGGLTYNGDQVQTV